MDAFIFTRFGNRKIPAKPLKTQQNLDGSSVDSPRKDDIYSTPELAEKASDNDDYDDVTSNESWKEITNKIKKIAFTANKVLQVILRSRDENNVYFPKKVLKE